MSCKECNGMGVMRDEDIEEWTECPECDEGDYDPARSKEGKYAEWPGDDGIYDALNMSNPVDRAIKRMADDIEAEAFYPSYFIASVVVKAFAAETIIMREEGDDDE